MIVLRSSSFLVNSTQQFARARRGGYHITRLFQSSQDASIPSGIRCREAFNARPRACGVRSVHVTASRLQSEWRGERARPGDKYAQYPEPGPDDAPVNHVLWNLQELGRSPQGERRAGTLTLLEQCRRQGIKDIRVYGGVLRNLSGSVDNEVMVDVVEQLKEDGLQPDTDIYNYLIHKHAFNKDEEGALRMYEEMRAAGLEENSLTLSHLIVAYAWADSDEVSRLLKEMRDKGWHPSRAAYHGLIPWLRRRDDWEGIREATLAMKKESRVPNDATFGAVFLAARNLRDADLATLAKEMRNGAGFAPKESVFVNFMMIMRDMDRHDEVLECWRQLVCVDGVGSIDIQRDTFILALRSAVLTQSWKEIEGIVELMQARGIEANDAVYTGLVSPKPHYRPQDPKDIDRIVELIQRMESEGGAPAQSRTQARLGVMYSNAELHDQAIQFFDNAIASGVSFNVDNRESLIRTSVAVGRYEEAKKMLFTSSSRDRARFRGVLYQRLMHEAKKHGDADFAVTLLRDCSRGNKKTQAWFVPVAVTILVEADRLKEASLITKEVARKDQTKIRPNIYRTMYARCKAKGEKDLVVDIVLSLREKDKSSYHPAPRDLAFVMEALIEKGHPLRAVNMLEDLTLQNIQLSPECQALATDAAAGAENPARAEGHVGKANQQNLDKSNSIPSSEAPTSAPR